MYEKNTLASILTQRGTSHYKLQEVLPLLGIFRFRAGLFIDKNAGYPFMNTAGNFVGDGSGNIG